MSQEQRTALDAMLRDAPLDLEGDIHEQREVFAQMMRDMPIPSDVSAAAGAFGGVPVRLIDAPGADPERIVLYVHGGAYTIGSAADSVGLASDLARRAGVRAASVDYRLAPEHPFPAALEDTVAAYAGLLETAPAQRIVIAGESAGGGLALATLLEARRAGLPLPAAAVLMSPWTDLTLSGASIAAKASVDPALTAEGLRLRARDYVGAGDLADPRVSPLFGDLTDLPPLLVQAGSHEILLDDATRLAAAAAAADVPVTLQVTPEVPHVFQGFAAMLEEGARALDRAGEFVREALGQR